MTKKEKITKNYNEWKKQREDEIGFYCFVKLLCDSCGKRWVEHVKQTLPPCPYCGGEEIFEYETISVG
ncbi:MAG: hypothetical protein HPY60_11590 [Candidatus Methanofastidiosum sp.]|nr:hypothetical protein [Methanofastidiosum sp.]